MTALPVDMTVKLHSPGCVYWKDTDHVTACTCPRPWRIRKDTNPAGRFEAQFPWVVYRLIEQDETYEYLLRAHTFARAAQLVKALLWMSFQRQMSQK